MSGDAAGGTVIYRSNMYNGDPRTPLQKLRNGGMTVINHAGFTRRFLFAMSAV